jgi:cyclopropane fatty-acyl-phospholipid synthase-like methyltransferase
MRIATQYLTGEYQEKNPSFHVEDSPWKARQIQKMLNLQGASLSRVADVGCGAGEILAQLAKLYPAAKFEGFEMSPQGFALCTQRESDRVKFYNSDFCDSDARAYDIVLCIDVLEHVEDCFGFLRAIRRRGNAFIFHIPLDMNVQMVLRSSPLLMVRARVGHLHYFSKDTVFATLEESGYEVHSWFYTPDGVERPKSWKARLLRLPRKILFSIHRDLTVRLLGGYSLLVYALPRHEQA